MKVRFSTILVILSICLSYGQDDGNSTNGFDYASELGKMITIPNSPEAQAFTQYGNVPVDLYQGAPNVSIPIYTYKGLEFDLPMSLTYDINARKVMDRASNVGLGWNLNVGGRISRMAKGNPDDFTEVWGPYTTLYNASLRNDLATYRDRINSGMEFNSVTELDNYFLFLEDIQKGLLDTQIDYYSVNVMGVSDQITMDKDNFQPYPLNDPRLKVSLSRDLNTQGKSIETWTVIDGEGNKYFFQLAEETKSEHDNDYNTSDVIAWRNTYNSSWVLTKIISKNGKDTYDFLYTDFGHWSQPNFFPTSKIITTPNINSNITNYPEGHGTTVQPNTRYSIKQQHLTEIKHNGRTIATINLKNRADYLNNQDSAIDYIQILEPINQGLVYHYRFNHTYFGTNEPVEDDSNYESIRLKLDSISIAGSDYDFSTNYEFTKTYEFTYDRPHLMPSINSSSQDLLGFYNNGGTSTGILYPRVENGGITFQGNNRDFYLSKALVGILTDVKYPTGGYTHFEYEQHSEKKYQETTSSINVANVIAYSDQESSAICGSCCIDASAGEISDGDSDEFYVSGQKNYSVIFTSNSDVPQSGGRKGFIIGPFASSSQIPDVTIDDFLCGSPQPHVATYENFSSTDFLSLSQGYYKVFVYNIDAEHFNSSVGISVFEQVESTAIVTTRYPGIRIKSISDFDDVNATEPAAKKNYLYQKNYDSDVSEFALSLNHTPTLHYFLPVETHNPDANDLNDFSVYTVMSLHRLSQPISRSEPNVTYKYVIEEHEGSTGTLGTGGNFYTKYEFNNAGVKGFVPGSLSGDSNFYGNFKKGKLKEKKVYNQSNALLTSETTNYVESNVFSTSSFNVKSVSDRNLKYVTFYTKPNGKISFFYQYGRWAGFGETDGEGSFGEGFLYQYPNNCGDAPNIKCLDRKYSTMEYNFLGGFGTTGGASETIMISHLEGEQVTQQTQNTYSSVEEGFLLKSSQTTNSQGDNLSTSYLYPIDFSDTATVYDQMVDDNHLTAPVQVTSFNQTKTQIVKSNYKQLGSSFNPEFYVADIETSKNSAVISDDPNGPQSTNNPLEKRIFYEYYPNGNLKMSYQYKKVDRKSTTYGNLTTYIWGYDDQYLVAKVDNATYTQVAALSEFGSNFTIPEGLTASQDAQLRSALSNAQVTTYSYQPSVGVVKITDPRGNYITYEYDDFNRLEFTKDKDGNILNKTEYNYRENN